MGVILEDRELLSLLHVRNVGMGLGEAMLNPSLEARAMTMIGMPRYSAACCDTCAFKAARTPAS